ncbi:MAG: ABC transporter ATP-binding protein [Nitrospinae bacterium]|nr:ABC transporter ATP-binding protein [Nitrospinota bacterium]MBF0635044.1 ABC transporter ATP-binding protein [Nitrospinota bacterium]
MIKVENLTKNYGAFKAIDGISFNVERGEICGFLGPNGAGKTTTMRILTGFMPPTEGRVELGGLDIADNVIEVKKKVGYLPESTPLYGEMRVYEYLDFVAEIKGLKGSARKKKVDEVLETTYIADRRRSLIRSLSKGYRQRVGLAQALLNDPEVLILDEPTVGLDPKQIADIRSLIKDLSGKRTVILSSHILPEVQMICSRVLIINKGRVIAADTPERLSSKFAQAGQFTVSVAGPVESVAQAISNLPEVANVSIASRGEANGMETADYLLESKSDADPRKSLARMVVERDWTMLGLSTSQPMSLEDVYLKLVTEEPSAPPAAEGEET